MIKRMAQSVYNNLQRSSSRDVVLLVRGNKYSVEEYEDEIDGYFDHWSTMIINFNYSDTELPTLEELEEYLYNTFKKKMR